MEGVNERGRRKEQLKVENLQEIMQEYGKMREGQRELNIEGQLLSPWKDYR